MPPRKIKDPILKNRKPTANFYKRLVDTKRKHLVDWVNKDDIATHKIAYVTPTYSIGNQDAIVYPFVQEVDGKLVDFTRPPMNPDFAYKNAVAAGDTIHMSPKEAEYWTTHYKDFYPGFYSTKGWRRRLDEAEDFVSETDPEAAYVLNQVFDENPIPKVSKKDAARLVLTETHGNPFPGGSRYGFGQLGYQELVDMYGTDSAKLVRKEYLNKTRSLRNAALDLNSHLRRLSDKIPADTVTFGRLMVNQFAPNSSLSSKISNNTWENNVKYKVQDGRLPNTLKKGKSTYRDLMNAYDNNYHIYSPIK